MILMSVILLVTFCSLANQANGSPATNTNKQLVVYWGQDSAGSLRLTLEKGLDYYCKNYDYDIIPVAFLNVFFDTANKDKFPGINLANHCNTTFKGYPTLLNCTDVGQQIQTCQKSGKKILLSLGGAAGLYYFSSSSQATQFASTVWKLFLDGTSKIRPFHNAVLDGVDLDIEGGTTTYYADFVKAIRQLMNTDKNRKYFITGAPQCPYPDAIMGPGGANMVLTTVPQEFDYLFVQFYNNYCSIDKTKFFNQSIASWFNFAMTTKQKYGKGPLIFIGLPASPRVNGYQSPDVVRKAWQTVKTNESLGGFMLWDASFDMNNVISGQHYSTIIRTIMNDQYKSIHHSVTDFFYVVRVRGDGNFFTRVHVSHALLLGLFLVVFVLLLAVMMRMSRHEKLLSVKSQEVKVNGDKKYVPLGFY
eukprot:TCONS_00067692-protein